MNLKLQLIAKHGFAHFSFSLLALCLFCNLQVSGQVAQYGYSTGSKNIDTASYVDTNATATSISLAGAGKAGSACSNGYSTTRWTSSSTLDLSYYEEFTIFPDTGYQLDLTDIAAGFRSSSTGPKDAWWYYSLDGGLTWLDSSNVTPNVNKSCQTASNARGNWVFPNTVTVTSHTLGIIFRLYLFSASGSAGTFQVLRMDINGTVNRSVSYKNDAAAYSLDSLKINVCKGPLRLLGRIKNSGTDSLKSITATYEVDGVVQGTFKYTDTLLSGQVSNIHYFGTYNFTTTGVHNIRWFTSMPNGQADSAAYNDTFVANILVFDKPNPVITGKLNHCIGDSQLFSFVPNPGDSFSWSVASGLSIAANPTMDSLFLKFPNAGSYLLTLTEMNLACANSVADTIIVSPIPTVKITGNDSICTNATKLDGTKINGYQLAITPAGAGKTIKVTNATYLSGGSDSIYVFYNKSIGATIDISVTTPGGCSAGVIKNIGFISAQPLTINGASSLCSDVVSSYFLTPNFIARNYVYGNISGTIYTPLAASSLVTLSAKWNLPAGGMGYISAMGEDAKGCTTADTITVNIRKLPDATFSTIGNINNYDFAATDSTLKSYLWSVSDTTTKYTTNKLNYAFKHSVKATIALLVTDSFGCSATSDTTFNFIFTGINNISENNKTLAREWPNPFTDKIWIEGVEKANIQVYDINGRMIYNATTSGQTLIIPTTSWPAGIYTFRTLTGGNIESKKIVKY